MRNLVSDSFSVGHFEQKKKINKKTYVIYTYNRFSYSCRATYYTESVGPSVYNNTRRGSVSVTSVMSDGTGLEQGAICQL